MKRLLILLLLSLGFNIGFAQITNIKAGLWSDVSAWNKNALPTASDDIVLNFDITVDINAYCKSLTLNGHNVQVNSGITVSVGGVSQKLVLIELFNEGSITPDEYFKITYDNINRRIYIDTDSTNINHEYMYEYNADGVLVKSRHLALDNSGNPTVETSNEYIRDEGAVSLQIKSTKSVVTTTRNYYRSNIPGGYSYKDTAFLPDATMVELRDFTSDGLPVKSTTFYYQNTPPFNTTDSIGHQYLFQNGDLTRDIYFEFGNGAPFRDTFNYARGSGKTSLVYNFIQQLKGKDLLFFHEEDNDDFLHFVPFSLGVDLFVFRNYSNREIMGSVNTFYSTGEIKQSAIDNSNRWRKVYHYQEQ